MGEETAASINDVEKTGQTCSLSPPPTCSLAHVPQLRASSPHRNGKLSVMPFKEFALDGFDCGLQTQALLFALFLALYVVAVLGNITMTVVITLDACLHTSMYFFLKNLPFLDLCYLSDIYPKALADLLSSSKVITFAGCATQFFSFSLLVTTEGFLLGVVTYDRFIAVCRPLHYPITLCPSACAGFVLGCYSGGCFNTTMQPILTFSLPFCRSNHADHFYCGMPPLLKLACADTSINRLFMFSISGLMIVATTIMVLIFYGYITVTILRMRSGAGRHKLFSNCGSHMTAVSLFYGTLFVMYAQPGAVESMEQGRVVSVFYTLVIPMLNPLIYSLRNKDVKDALWRLGQKHTAT
ncbi:olfactory receptor 12-like [Hippopotamus amphibius kiboko]|uniref:olfactory receptor 12-like n=1 Tax=Hippopotamus amphibius kiboko TaxID=575201 RepID=UPI002599EDEF|nr:olfactory receptor 12-like [Hippopotamus amphibius kiboko]